MTAHLLPPAFLLILILSAAATVLGWLASSYWIFKILANFAVQIVIALSFCLIYFALQRRIWFILLAGWFWTANLIPVASYYTAQPNAEAATNSEKLRLMTINVHLHNRRYDLVAAAIAAENPDAVLLVEATPHWIKGLRQTLATYPHRLFRLTENSASIALLSRVPLRRGQAIPLGPQRTPALRAGLCRDKTCIEIIGVHFTPPLNPRMARARRTEIEDLTTYAERLGNPRLAILGDFNLTPWTPFFVRLLTRTGLRDATEGLGVRSTWFSDLAPFGLPIDYILVGPEIQVLDERVGRHIGSDHYPLTADLAF